HAHLLGGFPLHLDVELRRGIFPDEDRREYGDHALIRVLRGPRLQLVPNVVRNPLAIDDVAGHVGTSRRNRFARYSLERETCGVRPTHRRVPQNRTPMSSGNDPPAAFYEHASVRSPRSAAGSTLATDLAA